MSRRVLVTGAASGLGAALVDLLHNRGDRVLATDRAVPDGAEEVDAVEWLALDVRSEDDWETALHWVERHWRGLDMVVNNAGVAGGGRVDVCTLDEWRAIVDVNLFGMVRGIRTFTPMLKAQGSGLFVNVASLAGLVHPPGMASYNAVKAAVVALSETVAHELAPYGVRSTVVCPSYFRTNLTASLEGSDTDVAAKIAALVEESTLTAEAVAAAIMEGIDAGLELIVPDETARAAVALKAQHRDSYDKEMRRTALRMKQRADDA